MRLPFDKRPTTYAEQVALLEGRGMVIDDVDEAMFHLQHINYYRLGAYWLPFEADHASHVFRSGTKFSDVLDLYQFDHELRLLVLDAIERIEVSVRSQWAYQLAHAHGPHAHLDSALARSPDKWRRDVDSLTEAIRRSDELFVRHLMKAYAESLPPVWAACEVMTLGVLSRWYANLGPMRTRRAIAEVYCLDEAVLESWLHHLAYVRNICAHHSRLWNREFTILPKLSRHKPPGLNKDFAPGSRRLHNSLVILLHLLDVVSPHHQLRMRLKTRLSTRPDAPRAMGFPSDWAGRSVWRGEALW